MLSVMSESVASLRHKIANADELESVVRTMKAIAVSSIGQYENAVRSLDDYYRTVQLGLSACFKTQYLSNAATPSRPQVKAATGVIVFGSDQGLVGQFNEIMVEFVEKTLAPLPGKKMVWAVGERIQARLTETSLPLQEGFELPNSINAITALVGELLIEIEALQAEGVIDSVYVMHHRPQMGSIYIPVSQLLLPLDQPWRQRIASMPWPTNHLPEVLPAREPTLRALLREYLFVSFFRACAESLASENASRLAAMQRAEKNIDELQEDLNRTFHRLRQSGIDAELFDVVSGFEALR